MDTQELKKLSHLYEANWVKLLRAHERGHRKRHLHFLEIENVLEKRITLLKKQLGLLAIDPCPYPTSAWDCRMCDRCNLTMKGTKQWKQKRKLSGNG